MHSIASDITGGVTVNYYRTQEMDQKKTNGYGRESRGTALIKTKDQIYHLSNTNTTKIRDEVIRKNSQLIFKRHVAAVQGADDPP